MTQIKTAADAGSTPAGSTTFKAFKGNNNENIKKTT